MKNKRNYLTSAGSFIAGTLLAQVLFIARDIYLARSVGFTSQVDAWSVAFAGVNFLLGIFWGAASGYLVPQLQSHLVEKKFPFEALKLFSNQVRSRARILSLILIAIQFFIVFDAALNSVVIVTLVSSFLIAWVAIDSGLTRASLQAQGFSKILSLSPVVSGFLSLVSFYFLFLDGGFIWFPICFSFGICCENIFLNFNHQNKIKQNQLQSHSAKFESIDSFWQLVFAGTATALGPLIDHWMLTIFVGEGQSVYSYGQKITNAAMGLSSGLIATVFFPEVARRAALVANKKKRDTRILPEDHNLKYFFILALVFGTLLLAIVGFYLLQIFLRGSKVETTKIFDVQIVHLWMTLQIPFYLLGILGLQRLQIQNQGKLIFKIAATGLLVKTMFSYFLIRTYAVTGLAASGVAFYATTFMLILFSLRQKQSGAEQS